MNSTFKIHIDLKGLQKPQNAQKGLADIWFEINGTEFPQKHWNDFIFWILPEWSNQLIKILDEDIDKAILIFCDSNYAIELSCKNQNIHLIRTGTRDMMDFSSELASFPVNIKAKILADHLNTINHEVLQFALSNKINSPYLAAVEKWARLLDNRLKNRT
jgi:hypothetical protein